LILFVPQAIASPLDLNIRTCRFEELAFGASALALAGCLQKENRRGGDFLDNGDGLTASGPLSLRRFVGRFRHPHFLILRFIANLVPACIAGGLFWAYLTGAGFIAAGLSIATGVLARQGAFWQGVMFPLWFLFLHSPRMAMSPRNHDDRSSALIALGWAVDPGSRPGTFLERRR
jgi:hypothetical protein